MLITKVKPSEINNTTDLIESFECNAMGFLTRDDLSSPWMTYLLRPVSKSFRMDYYSRNLKLISDIIRLSAISCNIAVITFIELFLYQFSRLNRVKLYKFVIGVAILRTFQPMRFQLKAAVSWLDVVHNTRTQTSSKACQGLTCLFCVAWFLCVVVWDVHRH